MEVVFLLAAEQDLQQAYTWVVEHRHGKEQSFLHDVECRLEQITRFPLSERLYRGRYRRLLIPRYPSESSMWLNRIGLLSTRSLICAAVLRSWQSDSNSRSGRANSGISAKA
jgi:hypothetical protein